MRSLIRVVLLVAVVAALAAYFVTTRPSGPRIDVVLPAADGLTVGDQVSWNDIDIGRVEALEADARGVKVAVRLLPEYAGKVPRDSVFKVEHHGLLTRETRLEVHVLDPDSAPIADGDRLSGVGSALELALEKGKRKVGAMIDRAAETEWFQRGAKKVESAQRELEQIDWDALTRDARDRGRALSDRLTELAGQTEEEAKRTYESLRPELDKLAEELEAVGRSDEARRLRDRMRSIFEGQAPANDGQPPAEAPDPATPSATTPSATPRPSP